MQLGLGLGTGNVAFFSLPEVTNSDIRSYSLTFEDNPQTHPVTQLILVISTSYGSEVVCPHSQVLLVLKRNKQQKAGRNLGMKHVPQAI